MNKNVIFFISTVLSLGVLFGCTFFTKKANYRGKEYSIERSEYGVVFINEFNGVEYYIHDTVYQCEENIYCLIFGSQDKRDRWVLIQNDIVSDVDSLKVNFTSTCKQALKGVLLE